MEELHSKDSEKPVEVTPAMIEAGMKALNDGEADNWMPDRQDVVTAIYRAMRLLDRA